jgi:hypothetical protein
MKKYIQGFLTGAVAVGVLWAIVYFWNFLTIREGEQIWNVAKWTINTKLKDGEFLDIAYTREPLKSGLDFSSLDPGSKQLEVIVVYRRNNQLKRMVLPMTREGHSFITPSADVLERLDSESVITFEESNETTQVTAPGLAAPGL